VRWWTGLEGGVSRLGAAKGVGQAPELLQGQGLRAPPAVDPGIGECGREPGRVPEASAPKGVPEGLPTLAEGRPDHSPEAVFIRNGEAWYGLERHHHDGRLDRRRRTERSGRHDQEP
jgi:hypothetical protein